MSFSVFLLFIAQFLAKIGSTPFIIIRALIFTYVRAQKSIRKQYKRAINRLRLAAIFVKDAIIAFFGSMKNTVLSLLNVLKYTFFRKSVLLGVLSAVLVFSAFQFGFESGQLAYHKRLSELQRLAVVKIVDRNGTLLYTYRKSEDSSSPENYKRAPSFIDYTLKNLKESYGDALFLYGGTVKTTLDLHLQNVVQSKVIEAVMNNEPAEDASALVLDSRTNEVLALVGSIHAFDNPGYSDQSKVIKDAELKKANPILEVTTYAGKVLYRKAHQSSSFTAEDFTATARWTPEDVEIATVGNISIQTYLNKNDITKYISKNKDDIN